MRNLRLPLVSLCLFTLLPCMAMRALGQSRIDDFDVRVALYDPANKTERDLTGPLLKIAVVKISPDIKSVQDLLTAHRIYPDSGAVGLIYALNPDLRDVYALTAGQDLRIPEIEPARGTDLPDGSAFKIHYDERLIHEIAAVRPSFSELLSAASTLTAKKAADVSAAEAMIECVYTAFSSFSRIADHLQRGDQPTDHEMLLQVIDDINDLSQTVLRVAAPTTPATAADSTLICSVAKDLETKRLGFNEIKSDTPVLLRWPEALVVVNTYDSATHSPVSRLKVHYALEALQGVPDRDHVFSQHGSPAESPLALPEADYVFWATKEGSQVAVSDHVRVSVRKVEGAKPVAVDLLVR